MSEFSCLVVRVKIEEHPNADAIEIARVGDYQSIIKKGQFKDGDLAVYIPEQAVLPEWLLRGMGFWDDFKGKGGLAGALGNRVRAIKLRGVLSQGLMLGLFHDRPNKTHAAHRPSTREDSLTGIEAQIVAEGDDAAEFLGIVKYEPPLPSHMAGRILGASFGATAKYDFDNLKKTPELFEDGELVVITEKIHGTLLQVGVVPASMANEKYYGGRVVISSKGQGAKGYILDHNDETNLYAQAAKKHGLLGKILDKLSDHADEIDMPLFMFGEVFGKTLSGAGVQDLKYNGETLDFRVFDVCYGNRGRGNFATQEVLESFLEEAGLQQVPVLYIGPYSKDKVLELTDGKTTLGGNHIREGVVVKSAIEARHPKYGRKVAKSVSEAYLLRKGEVTEFQ